MNWDAWTQVEKILLEFEVKPILSVIPDNQDETLKVQKGKMDFWDQVRAWQRWGWTIGMHGYQHVYVTDDVGLVGVNSRSEFSGLTLAEQERKLRSSRAIFDGEGVKPEVWVAPGHSFDETTVKLLPTVGMHYISDGFYLFPRRDSHGLVWIPQQFWRFRWMPFGVWTVCQHINRWTERDVARFRSDLASFHPAISDFAQIVALHSARRANLSDRAYSRMHLAAVKVARWKLPYMGRPSS
jgi:predicted deacetylase